MHCSGALKFLVTIPSRKKEWFRRRAARHLRYTFRPLLNAGNAQFTSFLIIKNISPRQFFCWLINLNYFDKYENWHTCRQAYRDTVTFIIFLNNIRELKGQCLHEEGINIK